MITALTEKGNQMDDLINRQDVIGCVYKALRTPPLKGVFTDTMSLAISMVNELPSAQPKIVRCKNCKHYGCILYSGTQFEYGECFGHEESDYTFEVKPDDFCSRAERKTYE